VVRQRSRLENQGGVPHIRFRKFRILSYNSPTTTTTTLRYPSTKWAPTSISKSSRSASNRMSCVSFSVSDAGRCVNPILYDILSIATHTDQYFEMVSSQIRRAVLVTRQSKDMLSTAFAFAVEVARSQFQRVPLTVRNNFI